MEGVEYAIKVYESHPEPFRSRYAVGIPKEYGIFIPDGTEMYNYNITFVTFKYFCCVL